MVAADLISSWQKNEKRDYLVDSINFLKERKIKYEFSFPRNNLPQLPYLVVVNHFKRPFFVRKQLATTLESLITAALVTVALSTISKRRTAWVAKNNLAATFPFKFTIVRRAQLAAIYCYDLIGTNEKYPFSNYRQWEQKLKSGSNIAFCPEGAPSGKLKSVNGDFDNYIRRLKKAIPQLQILPVSVYYIDKTFFAKFNKPLKIESSSDDIAKKAIQKIAENLPHGLRGKYFA
ncbi:hypothetical protein HYZ70_03965 [Candidatus Curtissbacteria bacterium]|nr:hypothetical protein [Candidatus Curtissbacteria bacterium]